MGRDDDVDGKILNYWKKREKEKLIETGTLEKLDAPPNSIGRTFTDAIQEHPGLQWTSVHGLTVNSS